MKVIIAGGRDFIPQDIHAFWLVVQLKELKTTEIICGMAKGADTFGRDVAKIYKIPILEFPADWDKYGKSAGYRRNVEMAKIADACILFSGGKGTEHMRNIAIEYGLKLIEYVD